MKKILILLIAIFISSSCVFAAKYKVNTSGEVKTNGKVVAPAVQTKNPYNVYNSTNYVSNKTVNKTQVGTINLVMDYSGSMSNWIEQAKSTMSQVISQIPSSTNVGFRVFGYSRLGFNTFNNNTKATVKKVVKEKDVYKVVTSQGNSFIKDPCIGSTVGACSATAQVTPVQKANSKALISGMKSVRVGGATPLVYGLDRAIFEDFATFDATSPKKIVLITDGGENCGGDPCVFARKLMNQRNDVHIDVVLVSKGGSNLQCLADITGGKTYNVNNLSEFSTTLTKAMTTSGNKTIETDAYVQEYEFYND